MQLPVSVRLFGRTASAGTAHTTQTGEWRALGLVAGLVVGFCGLLLLVNGPHWFFNDDFEFYGMPGFVEAARAWSAGEVPLLSSCSWYGGALGGEFQFGIFSAFLMPCCIVLLRLGLPLPALAAVLAILHLVVLATGTYCLGRWRGLSRPLATLAALVGALSGYMMVVAAITWFSNLTSFAWLPWYWFGLELALDGRRSVARLLPAALALYLLIAAGWPLTVLMAVLVAGHVSLGACWQARSLRPLWPVAVASALGLALSAPAWLLFVEHVRQTSRIQTTPTFSRDWTMSVPWRALPGFVFPTLINKWDVGGVRLPQMDLVLAGGLVPCAAALAALLSRRGRAALREHGGLALFFLLSLGLAMGPGVGPFRQSFRWLPLVSLALGLLGAHLLQALALTGTPDLPGGRLPSGLLHSSSSWAAVMVLVVGGTAWLKKSDPTSRTLVHLVALTALCLAWVFVVVLVRGASRWRAWTPVGVVLASCALCYLGVGKYWGVHHWEWPSVEAALRDHPFAPDVRYLSFHTVEDICGGLVRQGDPRIPAVRGWQHAILAGNIPMLLGLDFVNGYSASYPRGMVEVFGMNHLGIGHRGPSPAGLDPNLLLGRESGPNGLLAVLGIDGVVLTPGLEHCVPGLLANGWQLAGVRGATSVYHRSVRTPRHVQTLRVAAVTGARDAVLQHLRSRARAEEPWCLLSPGRPPVPEVREFAEATLGEVQLSRCSVRVEVSNPDATREALVVFPRAHHAGYRCSLNGQDLPVEQLNLLVPAVRVPPGAGGTLELRYLPRSLVAGCWLAGLTLVAVLFLSWAGLLARRTTGAVPTFPSTAIRVGADSRIVSGVARGGDARSHKAA
jgi:hypothetical protein